MTQEITATRRTRALREWYRQPLGRSLAVVEQAVLADQLANLFGYHLVVIDPPWEECSLQGSRIAHQVIQSAADSDRSGLLADTDHWPIMTDSIDAIVLPHTLELSRDPHQVLREADRSLIPDGHLVILGFNPFSLWGVRRLFSRQRSGLPWNARFRSVHRIKDWLALLGFDTLHSQFLFQRPPVQSERILNKLHWMEPASREGRLLLSAGYILVARKRSIILTPLRENARNHQRLFPVGIPTSTQGNVRRVR